MYISIYQMLPQRAHQQLVLAFPFELKKAMMVDDVGEEDLGGRVEEKPGLDIYLEDTGHCR